MSGPEILIVSNNHGAPVRDNGGAITFDVSRSRIHRFGASVRTAPTVQRMILAVVARPGAAISVAEMTELLWGERADGGPECAAWTLGVLWMQARAALAAVGYAARRDRGIGFRAWPVADIIDSEKKERSECFTANGSCDRIAPEEFAHEPDDIPQAPRRPEADGRGGCGQVGLRAGADQTQAVARRGLHAASG